MPTFNWYWETSLIRYYIKFPPILLGSKNHTHVGQLMQIVFLLLNQLPSSTQSFLIFSHKCFFFVSEVLVLFKNPTFQAWLSESNSYNPQLEGEKIHTHMCIHTQYTHKISNDILKIYLKIIRISISEDVEKEKTLQVVGRNVNCTTTIK